MRKTSLAAMATLVTALTTVVPAAHADLVSFEFKQGEVVEFVTSNPNEADPNYEHNLAEYGSTAGRLGFGKYKLRTVASFDLLALPAGDEELFGLGIGVYAWPSDAAKTSFLAEDSAPYFLSLRSKIWRHLRVASFVAKKDTAFTVDTEKLYDFCYVWLKPHRDDEYDPLSAQLSSLVDRYGGKELVVLDASAGIFSTENETAPSSLSIIEWQSDTARQQFYDSEEVSALVAQMRPLMADKNLAMTQAFDLTSQ